MTKRLITTMRPYLINLQSNYFSSLEKLKSHKYLYDSIILTTSSLCLYSLYKQHKMNNDITKISIQQYECEQQLKNNSNNLETLNTDIIHIKKQLTEVLNNNIKLQQLNNNENNTLYKIDNKNNELTLNDNILNDLKNNDIKLQQQINDNIALFKNNIRDIEIKINNLIELNNLKLPYNGRRGCGGNPQYTVF